MLKQLSSRAFMPFTAATQKEIQKVLKFKNLPYDPFRRRLYSVEELMAGYSPEHPNRSLDARIAGHFLAKSKRLPDVHEALAQRIHDHAIDSALYRFSSLRGKPGRKIVGVMGSHSTSRDSADYAKVAQLAQQLVKRGFTIVTGGGPGIMKPQTSAPIWRLTMMRHWAMLYRYSRKPRNIPVTNQPNAAAAFEVRQKYKDSGSSLAIPTWSYSDEPTGQFSSGIGKYFSNSIREDGLLAIAAWGVIFAPGSAGTLQEVFQDVAHNTLLVLSFPRTDGVPRQIVLWAGILDL